MAVSFAGINPSVHVSAIQPTSDQAGSQTPKSATSAPSVQAAALQPKLNPTDSRTPKTATTQRTADVVEFSTPARARALRQQGASISEIAIMLNLDVKTAAAYIGAVITTTQAAQASPQGAQTPLAAEQQPSGSVAQTSAKSADKQTKAQK